MVSGVKFQRTKNGNLVRVGLTHHGFVVGHRYRFLHWLTKLRQALSTRWKDQTVQTIHLDWYPCPVPRLDALPESFVC